MLRVEVKINKDLIIDIHAQRMEGFKGDNHVHEYHAFEGAEFIGVIRHKYSGGGEELAVKLLRMYKKSGRRR